MNFQRFISFKEAKNRVSFSKSHIYRLIHQNKFPKPISLGPHKVAFLESEIEEWIKSHIEARNSNEGITLRKNRARCAVQARSKIGMEI